MSESFYILISIWYCHYFIFNNLYSLDETHLVHLVTLYRCFLKDFILIYVCVSVCVCMFHMCGGQWKSADEVGSTEAEFIGSCELLYMNPSK